MRPQPALIRVLALSATCVIALAVAACSGSSSSGSSSSGSSPSASNLSSQASASSCMTTASALVANAEKPVHFTAPPKEKSIASVRGRSIWFIEPAALAEPIEASQGFTAAAKAAGLHAVIYNGQGEVTLWNQGISEAVAQHAGGIVLQAINPADVSVSLKNALAAHIPVIDSLVANPDAPLNGLYAHVTANMTYGGEIQAAYALQHLNCQGAIGMVTLPDIPANALITQGSEAYVKQLCSACSTFSAQVPVSTLTTSTGPLVQDMVRSHPNIKAVLTSNDAFALLTIPALRSMHQSIPVVGFNGDAPNLPAIANGTQTADVAFPPLQYDGWVLVDQLIRAMMGEPPATALTTLPLQLFHQSNLNPSDPFPHFGNYEVAFKNAWGV
jgi:ribose transport system substrate-binding protein